MNDAMMGDSEKTVVGVLDPGEATQMVMQPQAEATQYAASVECPVCHTPNPPSESYCTDCGFLLSSAPVEIGEMPDIQPSGKLVSADGTREYALKPGKNAVGRENADVLLAHNTVSRRHAVIVVEDGGVYVEDCGSSNGTFVEGRRIEVDNKVPVASGAELMFGSAVLRAELTEAGVAEQAQADDEAEEQPEGVCEVEEPVLGEALPDEPESPPEAAGTLISKDGSLSFPLKPEVNSIGRRDGNDIVIPDAYCSGRHAELLAEDGKFTLTDLGSTNGSFVNGVRLDADVPQEIQEGDEITLGQAIFRIEVA